MTCTSKSQAIFEEDADSIVISDVDEVQMKGQEASDAVLAWLKGKGIKQGFPENIVRNFEDSQKLSVH